MPCLFVLFAFFPVVGDAVHLDGSSKHIQRCPRWKLAVTDPGDYLSTVPHFDVCDFVGLKNQPVWLGLFLAFH